MYSHAQREDMKKIGGKNEIYTVLQTPLSLINIQRVIH